jgi:hypothetical protein
MGSAGTQISGFGIGIRAGRIYGKGKKQDRDIVAN